ncbi:hypothetical protein BJV82DRAFT_593849 [Fennellomyces sp. T-0311]|nr:hypothetical protein BJV82DRAFT_593849 [Fennellomyces sp. T-0311]
MPHNNAFQPKSARIVDTYDDNDDIDDGSLLTSSSRKTTETQALADFLNSTGPEEFQRPTPSSTISSGSTFFKRRKNKQQQQQHPTPSIAARNAPTKHVEIAPPPPPPLAPPQQIPIHQRPLPRIPTSPTKSLASDQSLAYREPQSPILPNRRRESSLYSGSLRNKSNYGSSQRAPQHQRRKIMDLFDPPKEIDQIDAALLQRLETHQPRAAMEKQTQDKVHHVRHCQTQTTQTCIPLDEPRHRVVRSSITPGLTVEQLERQIAEEKRRQKRLQAAIEESTDQFEVLSGLAYIKLRELWEEKNCWVNAWYALNDRLEQTRHHHPEPPKPDTVIESVP